MAAKEMGMNNTKKEEEKCIGRTVARTFFSTGKLKSPRKEKRRTMPALSDIVSGHTIMASNIYQSMVFV
jgi:hypothetical protein